MRPAGRIPPTLSLPFTTSNLAHTLGARALREVLPPEWVRGPQHAGCVSADPENAADRAAARKIEVVGDEAFIGPMVEGRYGSEFLQATDGIVDWDRLIRDAYDLPGPNEAVDPIG